MLTNKYHLWYTIIINRAISANRVKNTLCYYERHHIIPRSLGGSDKKENLVLLTAKEHFVCHHLLTKFTEAEEKSKMMFAFWGLTNTWGRDDARKNRITGVVYAALKQQIAMQSSINNTGKSYPVTEKTRQLISEKLTGPSNPMYGKPAHNRGISRPGVGGRKKGTGWSAAERETQMKVRSQENYYDFLRDPSRCLAISNALKGRTGSATGKVWFNNGITETYQFSCPDNFVRGRLPGRNSNKKGMLWYNNGVINKQFKENCQFEGFIRGRLSKK